ncbi:MAG: hypothetical protein AMS22_14245 [Thiotrichales bacterium SG8_50]|nr:MAG: hypothetical protein AMS22_14245 [Thiotrichales bacterium SG8_50]
MSSRLVTILAGYEYGADGYLTKGIKREKIGEAIETVLSGNVYYMPGTKEELAALTNRMPVQGPLNPKVYLNLIDLKIFEFMAMGMTVDEVAENMCPSMNKKTIHNRVSQICSKLKIKRSQIQEVAIQYGLINPKL